MAGFKASEAVEALEYDFNPYVDIKGTVPEPSTDQLEAYFNGAKALASEVRDLRTKAEHAQNAEDMSDEEMAEILAAMDSVSIKQYQTQMATLVAELCSQQPSFDDLMRVPHRPLSAFMGWVTGSFSPERKATGSSK